MGVNTAFWGLIRPYYKAPLERPPGPPERPPGPPEQEQTVRHHELPQAQALQASRKPTAADVELNYEVWGKGCACNWAHHNRLI